MTNVGLGWFAHFLAPEEDRAVAENWKAKTKCLRSDPDIFFPPTAPEGLTDEELAKWDAEVKALTKQAKRLCKGLDDGRPCPVINECLEYAMENKVWEGVYGGTSGRERRKLASSRRKESTPG